MIQLTEDRYIKYVGSEDEFDRVLTDSTDEAEAFYMRFVGVFLAGISGWAMFSISSAEIVGLLILGFMMAYVYTDREYTGDDNE